MRYFTDSPYERMMMQKPKMTHKRPSIPPHKVNGEQKADANSQEINTTKKIIPKK